MLLQPNCKINLGLNIVSRRPDGYHDLETLFYPIPLRDNLEFRPLAEDEAPRLTTRGFPIASNADDNLVMRVYKSLREEFGLPPIEVELRKNIPMGAGLGGGSSDAAFMMKGLNETFGLGLSESDMERRMASFGADCAFFIRNRAAFATGIGDRLSPHPLSLKDKWIVLVKPDVFVSTKEAYSHITPGRPATPLLKALGAPMETWRSTVTNDFEASVFPQHPELAAVKQTLYDMGAAYAAMSGSGSTLFGIFNRPADEATRVFPQHFVFTKRLVL